MGEYFLSMNSKERLTLAPCLDWAELESSNWERADGRGPNEGVGEPINAKE